MMLRAAPESRTRVMIESAREPSEDHGCCVSHGASPPKEKVRIDSRAILASRCRCFLLCCLPSSSLRLYPPRRHIHHTQRRPLDRARLCNTASPTSERPPVPSTLHWPLCSHVRPVTRSYHQSHSQQSHLIHSLISSHNTSQHLIHDYPHAPDAHSKGPLVV